jgi:hypothetical protein
MAAAVAGLLVSGPALAQHWDEVQKGMSIDKDSFHTVDGITYFNFKIVDPGGTTTGESAINCKTAQTFDVTIDKATGKKILTPHGTFVKKNPLFAHFCPG